MENVTYLRPKSIEEASASLLANKESRILAGGTDLILAIERKKLKPSHLIDLSQIPYVNNLELTEKFLHLGAMLTIQEIHESQKIQEIFPAIAEAAGNLGCWQVRNRATLGGNLANAAPSAEMSPPLIALGAHVKLIGPHGERSLPLENFFKGPGSTYLEPGEIIIEVIIPRPTKETQMVYLRHSLRRSMDISLVNTAVTFEQRDNKAVNVRIVLGAVAPTPIRAREAENKLEGNILDNDLAEQAAELAAGESLPITDVRATAGYRRDMVKVLVRRALLALIGRMNKS